MIPMSLHTTLLVYVEKVGTFEILTQKMPEFSSMLPGG